MKTTTTKVTLIMIFIALVIGGRGVTAKQIDDARMERDLKIAENILGTLSSEGDGRSHNYFFGHNTKSSYHFFKLSIL